MKSSSTHLLIIDDDDDVGPLLARALERDGVRTRHVASVDEAIEELGHFAPQVIIIEPVVNGRLEHSAVSRLRDVAHSRGLAPRLIVHTSCSFAKESVEADAFFVKPTSVRELRFCVEEVN